MNLFENVSITYRTVWDTLPTGEQVQLCKKQSDL